MTTPRSISKWPVVLALSVLCFDPFEQHQVDALPRIHQQQLLTKSLPTTARTISTAGRTGNELEILVLLRGGASSDKSSKSKKTVKDKKLAESEEEVDDEEEEEEEEDDDDDDEEVGEEEEDEEEAEEEEEDEEETEVEEPPTNTKSGKKAIDKAMKEKDAAEALGDAIRDRADILREEDPFLQSIDWSVGSVGQAMGASDLRREGGGVQASQSSVIANYFLQSHGGAHALQCFCSALATIAGLGALFLNLKRNAAVGLAYTMLKRSFFFAMLKHVSGMLAAASIAAKAIPKIGLSRARQWMEQLVVDPVSQYVFFNALMLLWLPPKGRVVAGTCWWWNKKWIMPILLGPILLREVISNMIVISDVLVLWSVGGKGDTAPASTGIETFLKFSQAIVNAIMSVLVTPDVWRGADAAKRQAILAKLVGRVSLVLEVAIGTLLFVDALIGLFGAAFLGGTNRPPSRELIARLICIRLYITFLMVRKSKIKKVMLKMRGGASKLPLYILDVLYEPGKAMGIERKNPPSDFQEMAWYDRLAIGLGLSD